VFASQGPTTFVGDLLRKHQRLLLAIPRHGLGNSLRGYVSSFVYAALSGRRLVRFHGAEHAKVFDTLCHSFNCGFDCHPGRRSLRGQPWACTSSWRCSTRLTFNSKYKTSAQKLTSLRSTLDSCPDQESPLLQMGSGHTSRRCASASTTRSGAAARGACAPVPCRRSWGPHPAAAGGSGQGPEGAPGGRGKPDVPAHRDINAMFDIALHFRTRPTAIESKHPGEGTPRSYDEDWVWVSTRDRRALAVPQELPLGLPGIHHRSAGSRTTKGDTSRSS